MQTQSGSCVEAMIRHKLFLGFTIAEILVLSVLFVYGHAVVAAREKGELHAKRDLVKHFRLTDLSLWTEARYTRHPSQADLFTPFQDFPSALEHFPAGSIISPAHILPSVSGKPHKP